MSTASLSSLCERLLEAVHADEPEAWHTLLDEFGPTVLAVARDAGLDGDDVDDVFQTTWLALYRHARHIRDPGALAAWILTTARRESWRVRRRRGRDPVPVAEPEEPARLDDAPDDLLEAMERRRLVRRGLDALTARCRELLSRLFFDRDAPRYADIAQAMGMRAGSIGPTRSRCLAQLAGWLEEQGLR